MGEPLRGELTNSSLREKRFEFTSRDLTLGVRTFLLETKNEEMKKIKESLTPLLINSIARQVSGPHASN